jgi:hypothetical protein
MKVEEEILMIDREDNVAPETVAAETFSDSSQNRAVEQARSMIEAIFAEDSAGCVVVERPAETLSAYEKRQEDLQRAARHEDLAHLARYGVRAAFLRQSTTGVVEMKIDTLNLMQIGDYIEAVRRDSMRKTLEELQRAA